MSNSYVQNKGIVQLRSMGLEKITMMIILICTNGTSMEGLWDTTRCTDYHSNLLITT